MSSRVYTIETRLNKASDLVIYLESIIPDYSSMKRKMFHWYTNDDFMVRFEKDSQFVSYCAAYFNTHSRIINSALREIKGLIHAYFELKKVELKNLKAMIRSTECYIVSLIQKINGLKPKVTANKATQRELSRYRAWKSSLYYRKNKLNKFNNRLRNIQYVIDNKIVDICFGTKNIFDRQYRLFENRYNNHAAWFSDFKKNRDKVIFISGSKSERNGNMISNIFYNSDSDSFYLILRKFDMSSGKHPSFGNSDTYIKCDNIDFKYMKDVLKDVVTRNNLGISTQAISFRFIKRSKKWYIQLMFEQNFDTVEYLTKSDFGTIGLDYNNGFIQLAETDRFGNLINLKRYDLVYHGTGNKAKTEIEQVIHSIVVYAKNARKDIVIEDLDFNKSKASITKSSNKFDRCYNRMIHAFDYSRYMSKISDICFNNMVCLHTINPTNTSKIGKRKYSDIMKLTVHQSAAYVIARKQQGFIDKL